MLKMSAGMQVISITHLPQVAAKGMQHYLVYKTDTGDKVSTDIQLLGEDERLVHLAEMLGGCHKLPQEKLVELDEIRRRVLEAKTRRR